MNPDLEYPRRLNEPIWPHSVYEELDLYNKQRLQEWRARNGLPSSTQGQSNGTEEVPRSGEATTAPQPGANTVHQQTSQSAQTQGPTPQEPRPEPLSPLPDYEWQQYMRRVEQYWLKLAEYEMTQQKIGKLGKWVLETVDSFWWPTVPKLDTNRDTDISYLRHLIWWLRLCMDRSEEGRRRRALDPYLDETQHHRHVPGGRRPAGRAGTSSAAPPSPECEIRPVADKPPPGRQRDATAKPPPPERDAVAVPGVKPGRLPCRSTRRMTEHLLPLLRAWPCKDRRHAPRLIRHISERTPAPVRLRRDQPTANHAGDAGLLRPGGRG